MSAGEASMLIQVFRGLPQSLQANSGTVPWNKPQPLPSESLYAHVINLSLHSVYYILCSWYRVVK